MIISRTPYRVSYFGGGTDYHTWYENYGSALLTSSIKHYCYLSCRWLPPFFKAKSRLIWSQIQEVDSHDQINHPAIKAILKYLNIERGVEIHHQGDLPARSGLGSSSAFTVGLLNALYALQGEVSSKRELACEAVHIERHVMRENVGVQDQIQTAFGGLNRIDIRPNGDFVVKPLILSAKRMNDLQSHMLLFFTGVSRTASDIAANQIKNAKNKFNELARIRELVDEAENILTSSQDIKFFGELLDESWQLKRGLSSNISPSFVDDIYNRAKKAGAIGGKLLGAGGGGFMLIFARPEDQPRILTVLSDLLLVPFSFEFSGSQIVYYDRSVYSETAMHSRDFMHLKSDLDDKTEVNLKKSNFQRPSVLPQVGHLEEEVVQE